MYWDLNVPYPASKQQARQMALMAIQLGYDGIVWTRTVSSKLTPKDANNMELVDVSDAWRIHGSQQSLLRLKQPDYDLAGSAAASAASSSTTAAASSSAAAVPAASSAASSPFATAHSFGQKTRLHFVMDDPSLLHSLNPANATLHSYDLVSVASSNEKMFHAACSHESVDIVVIEAAHKMPFYLKMPAVNLAIERGIHFEFSYAPAIRDASSRRYLFSNMLSFLRLTRGRNLILSSAAQREMEMRAPWDVINLGIMCGVDGVYAKAGISAHARSVLLHAEARKTIKCVLREVKPTAVTEAAGVASSDVNKGHAKPPRNDSEEPRQKKGKFVK